MKLPRGILVHENLNTAYTNFDQLLEDLIRNQFSGYVALSSWKYSGIILMDSGNLVSAVEELEGVRRTGPATLERVRARAKEKDVMVNVHGLDRKLVALVAGTTQSTPLYEKLSTDLTGLDRLISSLQKEKLTGHVEIELQDQSSGIIFLENGASIAAFYSVNGTTTVGVSAQENLEQASRNGAIFNVYRADPANSNREGFVKPELIEAWQTILVLMEDAVDKATAPGNFRIAFKQGCLDHVDEFPFLDPFAGRFTFKDGSIHMYGRVSDAQLNGGLSRALVSSASYLEDRALRVLRDAMRTAVETQRAQLDVLGITPGLSQLLT